MYNFETSCIESDGPSITAMVEAERTITRRTFLKHVDRWDLREAEKILGYFTHPKQGLVMAADYHVSYHRSQYRGRPCYYFRHSAIEYVFTQQEATS